MTSLSGYALSLYHDAVAGMAVSDQPLQRRVADAYVAHLIKLEPGDFQNPDGYNRFKSEIQDRLRATLTVNGPHDGIQESCRELSDEEAYAIAQAIVELRGALDGAASG